MQPRVLLSFTAAFAAFMALATAQTQTVSTYAAPFNGPFQVADGPPNTCSPGTTGPVSAVTALATTPGQITSVRVSVGMAIDWLADLRLTLTHNGVSVPLLDGSPANGCGSNTKLLGVYDFDDAAAVRLTDAAAAVGPNVLPPGPFKPAAPLEAFAKLEARGEWILSCADDAGLFVASIWSFAVTITTGMATFGDATTQAIPPGSGGGCTGTPTIALLRVVNVPRAGTIEKVVVTLGLETDYFSSLDVLLSHGGQNCSLLAPFNAGVCSASNNAHLDGHYVLDDDAIAGSLAYELDGTGYLLPGRYEPAAPLAVFGGREAAGNWDLIVRNGEVYEPATLTYLAISIHYADGFVAIIHQPVAGGPIQIHDGGGAPGDIYFNAVSLAPQGQATGLWFGLDISFLELAAQITSGPPFVGLLDACGQRTLTLPPGAVPPGISLAYVGATFDLMGQVKAVDALRTLTTM
jgi:hypothetical protein